CLIQRQRATHYPTRRRELDGYVEKGQRQYPAGASRNKQQMADDRHPAEPKANAARSENHARNADNDFVAEALAHAAIEKSPTNGPKAECAQKRSVNQRAAAHIV